MRLRKIIIRNYGPFKSYEISFPEEEMCLLLTGKNNEGKTTIINALRLLESASRVIKKHRNKILINGDEYYSLLKQDTENLNIGRLIYNYEENIAQIIGQFYERFTIKVFIDASENIIYADYEGIIPADVEKIFGFIPPLGTIAEEEQIIKDISHIRASLKTTLAPRHLRNHMSQLLSVDDYRLVQEIIQLSWSSVVLKAVSRDYMANRIDCFYEEDRYTREIAWAGQGLQVWFQIITHLIRLRYCSVLILDEPEIFLHPEKQNDLVHILKEYFNGSIVIVTHSVELINSVDVSHILNIQKNQ